MAYTSHSSHLQTHQPPPPNSPYPPMYHQSTMHQNSRTHRPPVTPSHALPTVAPSPQPTHNQQTHRSSHSQQSSNQGVPTTPAAAASSGNPACSLAKLQQLTHGIERCQSIPPQVNLNSSPQPPHNNNSSSTLTPPPNMNMGMGSMNMSGMGMNMNVNMRPGSTASANASSMAHYQKYYAPQMGHHMPPTNHPPRSASAAPAAAAASMGNHNNHHLMSAAHAVPTASHTSTSSSSKSKSSRSSNSSSNSNSNATASSHANNNNSNSVQQNSSSSSSSAGSLMPPSAPMGSNLMHYGQYPGSAAQFAAAQYFSGAAGFLNQHPSHAAAMQMIHGHAAAASSNAQGQYQDPRAGQPGSMYPYAHYPGHPGLMPQLNPSMRR